MKKLLLLTSLLILLGACSSTHKQLGGPCTYNNRSGCGTSVPLQQVGTSDNIS